MDENRPVLKFNRRRWADEGSVRQGRIAAYGQRSGVGVRNEISPRSFLLRSPDRDVLGETVARQEFQGPMQRELLRVSRGDLPTDDELTVVLFDDQIADSAVGQLSDFCLDLLRQGRPGAGTITDHGVTLGEMQNIAALGESELK
jgi:hypothetical protein